MTTKLINFIHQAKEKHPEYVKDYELVEEYFKDKEFEGVFPKELVEKMKENHVCENEEQTIIDALTPLMYMASSYAFCQCSQFPVGGCCYCKESGNAYIGFNMEASKQWIQYTVHGEQCTLNNAFIHGEKQVDLIVISFTPCGFCRQFLNQLKNREELIIHIITLKKTFRLPELLPFDFRPSDLPVIEFPDPNKFTITKEGDDCDEEMIQKVVECAKQSRLDNLLCYLAVGLITKDKKLVVGNYIENCAHNPSFHPMNGAISQLALRGKDLSDVEHVITVEYDKSEFQFGTSYLNILRGYGYKDNAKITRVTMA